MQRKTSILAIALALLVSGLWLSVGTRADEEPAAGLPKAETLPRLEVTIKSHTGGNFSSYSMPAVDTVGTLDFKVLSSITESGEMISFKKVSHDPEAFEDWYIPMPGALRVDGVSSKYGRQQVRLIAEGIADQRLRIELDYHKDRPGVVQVWIMHEYKGFMDSVAFGEAKLEGPILKDQAHE